jgi:hypothetical protein
VKFDEITRSGKIENLGALFEFCVFMFLKSGKLMKSAETVDFHLFMDNSRMFPPNFYVLVLEKPVFDFRGDKNNNYRRSNRTPNSHLFFSWCPRCIPRFSASSQTGKQLRIDKRQFVEFHCRSTIFCFVCDGTLFLGTFFGLEVCYF